MVMSSKKRKVRELAMQVLFVWDASASDEPELARLCIAQGTSNVPAEDFSSKELDEVRRDALDMAKNAWRQRETTDPWVERVAPQWPTRRQPGVDRALIRLAVWEMTQSLTPPKVVIDEAIELAREFSTENSPSFVNGVLDAIMKEHKALTGLPGSPQPEVAADAVGPANPEPGPASDSPRE